MPDKSLSPRIKDAIALISSRQAAPFYLYDGDGIVENYRRLLAAFSGVEFGNYFAVKALPARSILTLLDRHGSGFDCASLTELQMVTRYCQGPIAFTGNNVNKETLAEALAAGASVTLDDETAIELLPADALPPRISLRVIFGDSGENVVGGRRQKFGIPEPRIASCVARLRDLGISEVGLHCMQSANQVDNRNKKHEAQRLIQLAAEINQLLPVTLLNFGGGIGIPYRPGEPDFDIEDYTQTIIASLRQHFRVLPQVAMECGRYIAGPHGYLAGRVVGLYQKPHRIIGLTIASAMIPRITIYPDAWHYLSFPACADAPRQAFDVVGSMCESSDKLARQRLLPRPTPGEICVIHDAGAHCISMANSYNGFLRPAEYLLYQGELLQIVRAETLADLEARAISVAVC
ncbi:MULTISPECIES: diaminopimelate decarboxylase family protein [Xenorhabdus]|uniref:diaminopimelate decarboxylase family protein n=1 Tax=Xenorhabdus TaxID=626 RepID=UPI000649B27D|nr:MULTISPECIES: hypothetical protein [Xenorhabdus]KLU15224.1 hypothetical protein AAY47_12075 [Xenorhabdus griffiniae]KOP31722.1 hypothetical protein AFK69_19420 [Xenorhabdus sp. GDc328]